MANGSNVGMNHSQSTAVGFDHESTSKEKNGYVRFP